MSTTLEIVPLEGIDEEGSPPCGTHHPVTLMLCGKPSGFRIFTTCPTCGDSARGFICAECQVWIEEGQGTCLFCTAPRGITGYC